ANMILATAVSTRLSRDGNEAESRLPNIELHAGMWHRKRTREPPRRITCGQTAQHSSEIADGVQLRRFAGPILACILTAIRCLLRSDDPLLALHRVHQFSTHRQEINT